VRLLTAHGPQIRLRSLRKNPGFTLLAVVVMALGIGANTAVFSVVNAVLLKPLAYRDPDRIVTLASLWRKSGGHGPVSAPDFHDWHDQSTAFAAMAYYEDDSTAVMAGASAEYAHVAEVTPEFFRVFGVEPVAGPAVLARGAKAGQRGCGGDQLFVLAESLRREYRQRAGQAVRMLGKSFSIAGVLPPRFSFPNQTDIWLPANTFSPRRNRAPRITTGWSGG
jgi:hypothetical protein